MTLMTSQGNRFSRLTAYCKDRTPERRFREQKFMVPPNSPLISQHSFVERCVPNDGGLVGWTAVADGAAGMVPMPTHNNAPWGSGGWVQWAPGRYSVGRSAFGAMTILRVR